MIMNLIFDKESGESFLVFGEIKSLYDTCQGESGVIDHLRKMKLFNGLDMLIEHRKADAEEILKQYLSIEHMDQNRLDGLSKKLKYKNVLVFTNSKYRDNNNNLVEWDRKGSAMKFYEDNKPMIVKAASESDCEIWLLDGNICCNDEEMLTLKSFKRLNPKELCAELLEKEKISML